MRKRMSWSMLSLLCVGLVLSARLPAAENEQITVLNPRGIPPGIEQIPMAPRLASLDGKTVYFVDDGFLGGDVLLNEMIGWFNRNQPGVKTEFRKKAGGFAGEDPALFAELKDKADAVVVATGH